MKFSIVTSPTTILQFKPKSRGPISSITISLSISFLIMYFLVVDYTFEATFSILPKQKKLRKSKSKLAEYCRRALKTTNFMNHK